MPQSLEEIGEELGEWVKGGENKGLDEWLGERKGKNGVANDVIHDIIVSGGGKMDQMPPRNRIDIEAERQKIMDGTYLARIVQGRQRKHITATVEFEQNRVYNAKRGSGPCKNMWAPKESG